ncbi:MAG: transposase [Acidobacteriota bacterium]
MRRRHVQQELRFSKRGGKQKRAGRPAKGPRPSERHKRRTPFKASEPIHVVIRATPEVGNLRRRDIYHAVRKALVTSFKDDRFRIVHISIQGTHVHLLCEAHDRMALARGMQGFQISAAKHINAAISKGRSTRRRGSVFPDRYHPEIITSRRRARHALAYVLNNWRKHKEHRAPLWHDHRVDPFSSGPSFEGWRDVGEALDVLPDSYEPLPVWHPKTWLLAEGWKLYGLIGTTETPGRKRVPEFAD